MLVNTVISALAILALTAVFEPVCAFSSIIVNEQGLPKGFTYVREAIPDVTCEMRYYSGENFVGKRIDGYLQDRCILSADAAFALQKVQQDLRRFGLSLKIFDAYRPQSAVDHFVRWAKDLKDTKMKDLYYPKVAKEELFKEGYIAERSSHSRGSTVDITVIDLKSKSELDMGSGFDLFDPVSWPSYPNLTAEQRANRMLLRTLMDHHGFEPYKQEWWHFTLRNEPFPDTYFDFPVK